MQEYNWRKEREKYRPNFMKQPEQQPGQQPPPPPPIAKSNSGVIAVVIVVVIVVIAIVVFASRGGDKSSAAVKASPEVRSGDPATMLAQAAELYKSAVGLVVATVELKNGNKVPLPIGTAWAFAPDKFATNAHVANGLADTRKGAQKSIAASMLEKQAKQNGFKDIDGYLNSLGESRAKALVEKCMNEAAGMIRHVDAAILINGAHRKGFPIEAVQIHRDCGVAGSKFHPDVAVLTIDGQNDVFFKMADDSTLAGLKSGEPIAFLGFPMENLDNDNVNIDNPVASMQSGIVVAVSDFELKDAGASGNYLIRHNLPATGGASGSPIFNRDGEVVALLFAGNIIGQVTESGVERAPSAVQINFAVRSDLLRGMGNPIGIGDFMAR